MRLHKSQPNESWWSGNEDQALPVRIHQSKFRRAQPISSHQISLQIPFYTHTDIRIDVLKFPKFGRCLESIDQNENEHNEG